MKQIFLVALTFSLSLIVSVYSDGSSNAEQGNGQAQASSGKNMAEEARISAEASKTNDGRVVVTGKTNLPDNTELLISLTNESIGFTAQDESIIKNRQFSAGPLGPISGLAPGNYVVEVMMPVPSVQPESVQSIVGNEGQYLTGPLVKDTSWGGKTVEYSFPYTVGSKESIQQVQSGHAKLVSDVRSRIEQLLKNGRAMERFRNTDDLAALKTCGEMMRENQAKAKAVRSKAETLPTNFDLKAASVDVYSCVSCSGTAIEACERVAESLKKVK